MRQPCPQMEQVMGPVLIVASKSSRTLGLDPGGCADVQKSPTVSVSTPAIAYVDGDNLLDRAVDLAESGNLVAFDPAWAG